jgi:iron complex outermembrane receptor protein
MHVPFKQALLTAVILQSINVYAETIEYQLPVITVQAIHTDSELNRTGFVGDSLFKLGYLT